MELTPRVSALKRLRQEDCPESKANLGNRVRPCLKKATKKAGLEGYLKS